jgi:hypothetical protein
MKKNLRFTFVVALIFFGGVSELFAQGATKAGLNGSVQDATGEPLPGATVLAVHQPTGTEYGTVSNLAGQFTLSNMRVGGPYTVTISFVGYEPFLQEGINLELGERYRLVVEMAEQATQLEGVEVLANQYDLIDGNRTGPETVVSEEQINATPTVSRSLGDFTRLNPQVSLDEGTDGYSISIAGINNRYNAIYIDGAVNNDVFGLAGSGTNGGQTGVSPISVDAIEQLQVAVAPFDVRQSGFAGGAINVVTRSGSNEFEGSAYYLWRNESLAGVTPGDEEDISGERTGLAPFTARTYGARLGGPIVKNKLFFFVNAELQREETPLPFQFERYDGNSSLEDINGLSNLLIDRFNYDPGTFLSNRQFLNSDKFLGRLDYNISRNHKLSLRHSYVEAENLEGVQSDPRAINFLNNSEYFLSTTNSTTLELSSNFGPNTANKLIIGYTRVRDDRDPFGANFPKVDIDDGDGFISFGSEEFSTANQLDQDILTITNNFEWYKGRHTFTFGTHNEFYSVYNLFIRQNYGVYEYDSLQQYLNDVNGVGDFGATEYNRSYSLVDDITGDGSVAGAAFGSMQLGLYVQDEFQVTENFKLTGGLRIDVPVFGDGTPGNPTFNNEVVPEIEAVYGEGALRGARTGDFVNAQLLFAPRLGFNWDMFGDGRSQLRGGIGIFNSRIPLVWPGGAYNNNGSTVGGDRVFRFDRSGNLVNVIRFNADWQNQPRQVPVGSNLQSGQIDLFASDFRFPQVGKINLGYDQQLPFGLIGTLEFLYTDFLNNIYYQNLNIRPSTENLELPEGANEGDDRPIFNRRNPIEDDYTGIYLASNTDLGYTYLFTAQLQRPFRNGFLASLAYTYNDAYTVYDGTSSQNSSQWRGLNTVEGRNEFNELNRSDFAAGSRIIGQLSYRKEYGNFGATQLALLYEGYSGRPFTYIVGEQNGNFTNEDSRERSLLYVPANSSQIVFGEAAVDEDGDVIFGVANPYEDARQQEMYAEFEAYIESDDYLSERRGQYTERNASRAPWNNLFDVRILQDFYVELPNGKRNTLQLSLDIFNVANLLNNEWGQLKFVSNQFELVQFQGFEEGTNIPVYSFNGVDNNDPSNGNFDDRGFRSSRWQMQLGLRYIFGD